MGDETSELFYVGGKPGWRIRVPQPERFRGVDYDVRFRLFPMKKGVLVGCWLRLFDIPDQPYFVHRVLDLLDPDVMLYMSRVEKAGRMALVYESMGASEGFVEAVSVKDTGLADLLAEAGSLIQGREPVGGEVLDAFMKVFNEALTARKDVGQAWDAVAKRKL